MAFKYFFLLAVFVVVVEVLPAQPVEAADSGVSIKNVVSSNVILSTAMAVNQIEHLFVEHPSLLQAEPEILRLVLHTAASPSDS